MKRLLYIIGPPGAGKTTSLAKAIGIEPVAQRTIPFAYVQYRPDGAADYSGCQLGLVRSQFGGTDAMGMSVQPKVIAWLGSTFETCVVAEGDRLANDAFFDAAQRAGWKLTVVSLIASWDLSVRRVQERARKFGTKEPEETWLKGRHTKCVNLTREWVKPEWRLKVGVFDQDQQLIIAALREHDVIRILRGDEPGEVHI